MTTTLNSYPCKKCLFIHNCKGLCKNLDKDHNLLYKYLEILNTCPDCENKNIKTIYKSRYRSVNIITCENCNHMFTTNLNTKFTSRRSNTEV